MCKSLAPVLIFVFKSVIDIFALKFQETFITFENKEIKIERVTDCRLPIPKGRVKESKGEGGVEEGDKKRPT